MGRPTPLKRRFFRRDPVTLARALLGKKLVRQLGNGVQLAGLIVETEAYLGIPDRAAHSFGGRRTKRTETMWMDAGHAYVYFTYGMHWLLNVVAEREGQPTACLIRALEPLDGVEVMRRHRGGKVSRNRLKDTDLCSGPAKLTQALRIDGKLGRLDISSTARSSTSSEGNPYPKDASSPPLASVWPTRGSGRKNLCASTCATIPT